MTSCRTGSWGFFFNMLAGRDRVNSKKKQKEKDRKWVKR